MPTPPILASFPPTEVLGARHLDEHDCALTRRGLRAHHDGSAREDAARRLHGGVCESERGLAITGKKDDCPAPRAIIRRKAPEWSTKPLQSPGPETGQRREHHKRDRGDQPPKRHHAGQFG